MPAVTIADLISSITNARTTPSGNVEWDDNSLEDMMTNVIKPLHLTRGVMQVADVSALQLVDSDEAQIAVIDGTGVFVWAATGTPDSVNIFSAPDGVWKRQYAAAFTATLGGLTDVNLGTPTNGQALTYHEASTKWINSNISTTVTGLTDVALGTPGLGSAFVFNNVTSKWVDTGTLFTVAPASGNTVIAGTLAVTGASTLTGNVSLGGTLAVTGNTTLTGTLGVTGNITGVNASLTGTLAVTGNVAMAGTLAVTGALTAATVSATGTIFTTGHLWTNSGIKFGAGPDATIYCGAATSGSGLALVTSSYWSVIIDGVAKKVAFVS